MTTSTTKQASEKIDILGRAYFDLEAQRSDSAGILQPKWPFPEFAKVLLGGRTKAETQILGPPYLLSRSICQRLLRGAW